MTIVTAIPEWLSPLLMCQVRSNTEVSCESNDICTTIKFAAPCVCTYVLYCTLMRSDADQGHEHKQKHANTYTHQVGRSSFLADAWIHNFGHIPAYIKLDAKEGFICKSVVVVCSIFNFRNNLLEEVPFTPEETTHHRVTPDQFLLRMSSILLT